MALAQTPRPDRSGPNRFGLWGPKLAPYLFISPFFILFIVFGLFPTLFSFYLSFQTWEQTSGLETMAFNGLENYTFTLLQDDWFWKSVVNTLILGAFGLLIQPLAIVLAFAIQTSLKRFAPFVTALYFLPYITSSVAVALVFSMVFSRDAGLLNAGLAALNGVPLLGALVPDGNVNWLGDPATIKPAIALVVLWRYLGWNVLLLLSRMQAIPADLYEAAKVDGATTRQRFWHITLPQLRSMIFFTVTLTIIGQMQLFDEPFILVGNEGGVAQSGLTVAMYLYNTAFEYGDMGTASAIAWVLFAFMLVLSVVNNRVFGAGARARGE